MFRAMQQTTTTPRPYRAIPEPPRSGPLGHLPAWVGLENAQRTLERLQLYGSTCGPIARLTLGPVRMVVITDPDLAREALSDTRANYKGAAYILTRFVLDNVLLLNGDAWEGARSLYAQALKGVDPLRYANRIAAQTALALARQAHTPSLELDHWVNRLVGNIVAGFVAGIEIGDDFEPHRKVIQYELAAMGIDLQCRPWSYFSPVRWAKLRWAVHKVRAYFRPAVERRLAHPDAAIPDILNGFITLAQEGKYPNTIDAILDGVVNFFFTAHDVLASTTAWFLYALASHRDVQHKLQATLPPAGTELPRELIDKNVYLGQASKEALRLYPGYSLFGRTTQAPMTIGGYHIPAGTMLIFSPYATHRMERYWRDAERFDPERFASAPFGTPPAVAKDNLMPFGSGARGCIASHLAHPLMKTIVANVMSAVELTALSATPPRATYWGTAYPEGGMKVGVRARPATN